jgi:hypothetical protein
MIGGAVRTLLASTGTTMAVLVTLLVVIGLTMIGVAIWLVRSTRTDPVALAPLEVMGERRWRKGDSDRRQTRLETARPLGAPSPAPMVAAAAAADLEPPEGTDPTPPETAAPPEAVAATPQNCESSMQESAVSAHTSGDEGTDAAPDVADTGDGSSSE